MQISAPRQIIIKILFMDINDKKVKEVRKVESAINQNLFFICTIVTLVTMVLMVTNFVTRGSFLPDKNRIFLFNSSTHLFFA